MPVAALRVGSQAQSHSFRLALPNVWVEAVEYGRRRPAGGVARDLLREVRPPVEVRAHAEVGARPHVGRVLVLRRRVVRPKDRVVSVDPSAGAAAEEAARAADDGTAREAATAIEPPAGEPRCGRLGDARRRLLHAPRKRLAEQRRALHVARRVVARIVPVCPQGRHLRERPPRIRFCPVGVQAWDRQKRAQMRCARAKSSWSAVVAQRRWRLVGKQGRRAADAIGEDTELRVVHAGLADGRMRRVHADARRLLAPRVP